MKSSNSQFYLDRAAECRLAAEGTSLAEVRRKFAEAEESWRTMATLALSREDANRSASIPLDRTH